MMDEACISDLLNDVQTRINRALDRHLPNTTSPLHSAMRYAALNGGKRVRAAFVMTVGQMFDADNLVLDQVAAAVECMHAYSLIHDDLPAMDDDDFRRGKPSTHKAYDEACAILAGDALQCFAFELLSTVPNLDPACIVLLVRTLSQASGASGMVLGQAYDLAFEDQIAGLETLEMIHQHKTGALLAASLVMGAIAAGITEESILTLLRSAGAQLGLAFQIQDDVLEATSDSQTLGKPSDSDAKHGKLTYPELMGIDAAQAMADSCVRSALDKLESLDLSCNDVTKLASYITKRVY